MQGAGNSCYRVVNKTLLPLSVVHLCRELHLGQRIAYVVIEKPPFERSSDDLPPPLLQDGGHEQRNQNKLERTDDNGSHVPSRLALRPCCIENDGR